MLFRKWVLIDTEAYCFKVPFVLTIYPCDAPKRLDTFNEFHFWQIMKCLSELNHEVRLFLI